MASRVPVLCLRPYLSTTSFTFMCERGLRPAEGLKGSLMALDEEARMRMSAFSIFYVSPLRLILLEP